MVAPDAWESLPGGHRPPAETATDGLYGEAMWERYPGGPQSLTRERFGLLQKDLGGVTLATMRVSDRLTMSIKDACDELNISRATLYRWLAEGRIRSVKVNRRNLIITASVHALLAGEATDVSATRPHRPSGETRTDAEWDPPEVA